MQQGRLRIDHSPSSTREAPLWPLLAAATLAAFGLVALASSAAGPFFVLSALAIALVVAGAALARERGARVEEVHADAATGILDRDPVCGKRVSRAAALARSRVGDVEYVFCSGACHREFETRVKRLLTP